MLFLLVNIVPDICCIQMCSTIWVPFYVDLLIEFNDLWMGTKMRLFAAHFLQHPRQRYYFVLDELTVHLAKIRD